MLRRLVRKVLGIELEYKLGLRLCVHRDNVWLPVFVSTHPESSNPSPIVLAFFPQWLHLNVRQLDGLVS